ncbi:MAG: hypothetical protein V4615_02455 [Bacteroidota bacterium]
MGIGRREFLRLTSVALTGLAIDPLMAVAVNDNVYVNKKLGILFHKPSDWGFVAVKDFGKIKSEQVIGRAFDLTTEEILEELGDPICLVTKYHTDSREHKGIFSPTIAMHITPKEELEDLGCESFEEFMEDSLYWTSAILKEYRVVKKYEPYLISNCKFYEYDAEYLFEHAELAEPLKVELKVLKAEHNGIYYDFNCHQSKAQGQSADWEFEEFKKSIKLV